MHLGLVYKTVWFCGMTVLLYKAFLKTMEKTLEFCWNLCVHRSTIFQLSHRHIVWTHIYIHLYAHLIPTSQCLGYLTDTSCNFPHQPTVCNTSKGFLSPTVTFLKHFKFGRAAATTSPAPAVGEGQLIFNTTSCKQTEAVCANILWMHLCLCLYTCLLVLRW